MPTMFDEDESSNVFIVLFVAHSASNEAALQ